MKHSAVCRAVVLLLVVPATVRTQAPNSRPADRSGVIVFEAPKWETAPFDGIHLTWGAAFTQDFQNLSHRNTAVPPMVSGVNANQLVGIGPGFTTAMANLDLNVQLAKGIRVDLTTYLSTRHHTGAWVTSGYLQADASPWDVPLLNDIMKYLTVRVGQFEVNTVDNTVGVGSRFTLQLPRAG